MFQLWDKKKKKNNETLEVHQYAQIEQFRCKTPTTRAIKIPQAISEELNNNHITRWKKISGKMKESTLNCRD